MARFNAAFTLVELLVVISIIALLIAMLLPALAKARDTAESVRCLAMQRQFGIANNMYADDRDGYYLPSLGSSAFNKFWHNNNDFNAYLGFKYSNWNKWPKEFICPSADGAFENRHPTRDDYFGATSSWAVNFPGWNPLAPIEASWPRRRKLHTFGSPGHKLFLSDHVDGWSAKEQTADPSRYELFGERITNDARVAYRHNGAANVLFYDGHASGMTAARLWNGGDLNTLDKWFEVN